MAYTVLLNVRSRLAMKSDDLNDSASLARSNEIAEIMSAVKAQRDAKIRYAFNIEPRVEDCCDVLFLV